MFSLSLEAIKLNVMLTMSPVNCVYFIDFFKQIKRGQLTALKKYFS